MSFIIKKGYCSSCKKNHKVVKKLPNHLLHFFLSFFTGGLWLPVWIFLSSSLILTLILSVVWGTAVSAFYHDDALVALILGEVLIALWFLISSRSGYRCSTCGDTISIFSGNLQ